MLLQSLTWPEAANDGFQNKVAVVPLGSLEQHGHHLPLVTDTALVEGVARGVHEAMPDDIILLPVLWCGHSTHHLAFAGTVSLSQTVYQAVIVDICQSLIKSGASRILLLNGHGGNDVPVRYALREVKSRNSDKPDLKVVLASYWALAASTLSRVRESETGGMGHACEMETSMMMLLAKELVRRDKIKNDGPKQQPPYRFYDMQRGTPFYMVEEFHELSQSGTVGHPELASEEKGRHFYDGIIEEVSAFIRDFKTWD
jgi:creatinine amidohydrolase